MGENIYVLIISFRPNMKSLSSPLVGGADFIKTLENPLPINCGAEFPRIEERLFIDRYYLVWVEQCVYMAKLVNKAAHCVTLFVVGEFTTSGLLHYYCDRGFYVGLRYKMRSDSVEFYENGEFRPARVYLLSAADMYRMPVEGGEY